MEELCDSEVQEFLQDCNLSRPARQVLEYMEKVKPVRMPSWPEPISKRDFVLLCNLLPETAEEAKAVGVKAPVTTEQLEAWVNSARAFKTE